MSQVARSILMALVALTAACTTLSDPELQLDIPTQTVVAETPSDTAAQYERAKQDCADEGGNWFWYIHGDGFETFSFTMRCLGSELEPGEVASKNRDCCLTM